MLAAPGLLLVDNAISHAEEMSAFRALAEGDARVGRLLAAVGAGVLAIARRLTQARATPTISGRMKGGAWAIVSCSSCVTSKPALADALQRRAVGVAAAREPPC